MQAVSAERDELAAQLNHITSQRDAQLSPAQNASMFSLGAGSVHDGGFSLLWSPASAKPGSVQPGVKQQAPGDASRVDLRAALQDAIQGRSLAISQLSTMHQRNQQLQAQVQELQTQLTVADGEIAVAHKQLLDMSGSGLDITMDSLHFSRLLATSTPAKRQRPTMLSVGKPPSTPVSAMRSQLRRTLQFDDVPELEAIEASRADSPSQASTGAASGAEPQHSFNEQALLIANQKLQARLNTALKEIVLLEHALKASPPATGATLKTEPAVDNDVSCSSSSSSSSTCSASAHPAAQVEALEQQVTQLQVAAHGAYTAASEAMDAMAASLALQPAGHAATDSITARIRQIIEQTLAMASTGRAAQPSALASMSFLKQAIRFVHTKLNGSARPDLSAICAILGDAVDAAHSLSGKPKPSQVGAAALDPAACAATCAQHIAHCLQDAGITRTWQGKSHTAGSLLPWLIAADAKMRLSRDLHAIQATATRPMPVDLLLDDWLGDMGRKHEDGMSEAGCSSIATGHGSELATAPIASPASLNSASHVAVASTATQTQYLSTAHQFIGSFQSKQLAADTAAMPSQAARPAPAQPNTTHSTPAVRVDHRAASPVSPSASSLAAHAKPSSSWRVLEASPAKPPHHAAAHVHSPEQRRATDTAWRNLTPQRL